MLHTGGKTASDKSNFGDKRLEERMEKIIEQISEKPSVSIPQASSNAHQAKAVYRFLDNKKVMPEKILEHHIQDTLKAVYMIIFPLHVKKINISCCVLLRTDA